MGLFAIKLPDVGEGIAEAEIVDWNVVVGDVVREDDVLAVVMTDKANIEIPSSVSGEVVWLGGQVGDILAIGADLIRLEIAGDGNMAAHADVETPRAKLEAHATPATEVAELSAAFALSLEMGARLEDVAATIHAHPTLSEAFHEACLRTLGHSLHI